MRNVWVQRTMLLSIFILLDYLVTLFLISYPAEEANAFARSFMEIFGVGLGLSLFCVLINLPIYLILGLLAFYSESRRFVALPFATPGLDIMFAWFVAGTHFSGALSWISTGSTLLYQSAGALLYLCALFFVSKKLK